MNLKQLRAIKIKQKNNKNSKSLKPSMTEVTNSYEIGLGNPSPLHLKVKHENKTYKINPMFQNNSEKQPPTDS